MRALAVLGLVLAAYFQSGPLLFLFCTVVGLALMARFWLGEIVAHLDVSRIMERRLFFGESTTITLSFGNRGSFPIPWLEIRESLPLAMRLANAFCQVLTVAPGQQATVSYPLVGRRRGLHSIGPLTMTIGDVFGLARRELMVPDADYMLVYPRLLTAEELSIPALALFGDVRARRRMLGDPARMAGIREYQPGDPLHDIHWRATASTGELQVKHYEPATTIQTMICLDIAPEDYDVPDPVSATEFAITLAATIAKRLIEIRQEVGLLTNGRLILMPAGDPIRGPADSASAEALAIADPVKQHSAGEDVQAAVAPRAIQPGKGRAQLMRILELLARLEMPDRGTQLRDFGWQTLGLSWGSTVVVISGGVDDDVLMALHHLRESGLLPVVFVVSPTTGGAEIAARARAVGVAMHYLWLDIQALAVPA